MICFGEAPADVAFEDAANDRCFLGDDFSFASSDDAILQPTDDAVAETDTETDAATGFAELNAAAQPSPGLVCQLLQEHRVHRPLAAEVHKVMSPSGSVTLCGRCV